MIRKVNLNFKRRGFPARERGAVHQRQPSSSSAGCAVCSTTRRPTRGVPRAVVRIREYAGLEPGYTALTEILKQRITEQMAKPGVIYPARRSRSKPRWRATRTTSRALPRCMQKYKLEGWQEPFAKLKTQLARLRRMDPGHRAAQGARPTSACRPSITRSTWRTTASTFRRRSSPPWRTRRSPRSRAR